MSMGLVDMHEVGALDGRLRNEEGSISGAVTTERKGVRTWGNR
jgi:hypothetical protein